MSHQKTIEVEIHLPSSQCVRCGYEMDMATCISDEGKLPNPGDVSICAMCGMIMIFGKDLRLKHPTKKILEELIKDEKTRALISKAVFLIKNRERRNENVV